MTWFLLGLVALTALVAADWWSAIPDNATAEYVGGARCVDCHAPQFAKWQGSDHDRAMDRATPETVLADFDNAQLDHFGVTSRMFRRGEQFWVATEGPDGALGEFQVQYVFGVRPLQQYLVEFDRPADLPDHQIGRLQVLPLCWDTEKRQWFYLSPPDVHDKLPADDPLHWTGAGQNWNHMCGRCHTTNYQKGFDATTRTFRTTFTDIDVNCEACHGPGSLHLQLAAAPSLFWDRKRGYGLVSLKHESSQKQVETCAPCHARRAELVANPQVGAPFLDGYSHELLRENIYHADGQILEEDYEYGSFLQSKMFQKGIRCTDCHDPHSSRLKHTGNALCTSCHAHAPGKYDTTAHHHHAPNSAGAQCVACHMPETHYMEVDGRRDHSLRIPRPDLSVTYGTPQACAPCHLQREGVASEKQQELHHYADWLEQARLGDRSIQQALQRTNQWSADHLRSWYPEAAARPHFTTTLHAARQQTPTIVPDLAKLVQDKEQSGIVRATALAELLRFNLPDAQRDAALERAFEDDDPQVRLAAIPYLETRDRRDLLRLGLPRLLDARRAVRIAAARALATIPPSELEDILDATQQQAWQTAMADYQEGLRANLDQSGAWIGLALLAEQQGRVADAAAAYQQAMEIQPWATGPRSNLASLVEQYPGMIPAADAKVLREAELPLLQRDAQIAPRDAAVQYRLGLNLYLLGQREAAARQIALATQLSPNEPTYWYMQALLEDQLGRRESAQEALQRLLQLRPNEPAYLELRARWSLPSPPGPP